MTKYFTEEERKAAKKAAYKKWRLSHLEQERKRWQKRNAENREQRKEYNKKYRETHKEYYRNYMKAWEIEHQEERRDYSRKRGHPENKERRVSITKRAIALSQDYRYADANRGFDTTNNIDGIFIEKLMNTSCIYCGESDWRKLGADRIDNSKPHTPDNVVCACGVCNAERSDRYSVEEFKEYRKTHLRSCDFLKSIKPEIVSVDGIKVIRKRK